MEVQRVLHMNAGEGNESYAQNSTLQRLAMLKVKHILNETLGELCRFRNSSADCIKVADLGCSSGPNTLKQVEEIISCIDKAYRLDLELNLLHHHRKFPSVQVFLNDLEGNDFNTVFKSLPAFYNNLGKFKDRRYSESSCFIAAMPGSFHRRLFPDNSIHFVTSNYSLHWLSQVPKGLVTEAGMALNRGNIYLAKTSPLKVHKAYLDQFEKDFTTFLNMRSEEMVPQGRLLLTLVSKIDPDDGYDSKELIGMTLNDMVNEGFIEEEKLDDFNLPIYNPSAEEVKEIIEKEGSFKILRLETFKQWWKDVYKAKLDFFNETHETEMLSDGEFVSKFMRAVFEPVLASHFGEAAMDELFRRYSKKASDCINNGKGLVNNLVVSLVKEDNDSTFEKEVVRQLY